MATFIVLAGFTDQGIRNVKETIGRADAFKQMAAKTGITVKDIYWTLGRHDVVAICDVPDDEAATALSLSVASRGNVRSETLRAFSFDEMEKILGKMV
ncbi:MAG: GYD domain-containing protein [Hyphomicrobium sp.]